MSKRLTEEAIQLFDSGDTRSFNDLYKGKEDLFEDVDDLIDPRFKKLFEATYQTGNLQQKRLREATDADYNFSGDEPGPSGDGVPAGHNSPGLNGEDTQATQGQGRGDSNNARLFNESVFANVYQKSLR
jgi:hypothetical protein